jgi:hypothetical protein
MANPKNTGGTPTRLTEGHMVKGGLNPPTSQIVQRPPPPAPMRPTATVPTAGAGTPPKTGS